MGAASGIIAVDYAGIVAIKWDMTHLDRGYQ